MGVFDMDMLFAQGSDKNTKDLSKETIKDLALGELVDRACQVKEERDLVMKILSRMPTDRKDMIFRSEIVRDMMENKDLCDKIGECANEIFLLRTYGGSYKLLRGAETNLYNLLDDLRELSVYVHVSEKLAYCLHEYEIKAPGLIALREELDKTVLSEDFADLKKDIDQMVLDISGCKGAYICVDFTPDLDIQAVTAIEFVPHHIVAKYGIVERLVAPRLVSAQNPYSRAARVTDPLLASMAPYLQKHLKKHYADLKKALVKYTNYNTSQITEMYEGLTFLVAMARFGRGLREKGYEISFPDYSDDERFCIKDLYNIRLAIEGEENIVKNDFAFTEDERIFILTGPNRGGKTILEQGIGIASFMAASGLFVTASSFRGMPFGNILTHFPIDENLTINYGRLGEEAVRIKDIVASSTGNTLILFNETYSTTSASDGLFLSRDLIHVLKEKGSYVIFNTHLHDLARDTSSMNEWGGPGDIVSVVMERKDDQNTFILKRAEPDSTSYARNIAQKYGITYEQMTESGK